MKGKKTRVCQWCKVDDTLLEDMECEKVGKVNKFYHKHCHQEFLKDKEFKESEKIEKDELVEVLKKIYGVKEVPRQVYPLLESLRNGLPVFGARQNIGKRYKLGYKYSLIRETFEYCSDTIEYWNKTKDFNGFMGAFKYALSIVIDKIYIVEQRVKQREDKKVLMSKHLESLDTSNQEFKSNYKKKESKGADITDFLDD